MAEQKVNSFTKVIIEPNLEGILKTSYVTEGGIFSADIIGVSTDPYIQLNYIQVDTGFGVMLVDKNIVPEKLDVVYDKQTGELVFVGDGAEKYSVDQSTGHLIYNE